MNIDFPNKNMKTAFGELSVESKTPKVNLMFQYNINLEYWNIFESNLATISQANGKGVVQTGTTANSIAQLTSKDVLKYVPGVGADVLFTAIFTLGIADSEQTLGIGDQEDGFFFGYNGVDFGVLRRQGGKREIQDLTITAGASGNGNITITLDGEAIAIAVLSGDSILDVVNKILATDFSDISSGWVVHWIDNTTIRFISEEAIVFAGSFLFTDTDITGVTASSFTQRIVGISSTDTWTTQTNWAIDSMDGNGPSGQVLDTEKGNVYKIQYQWLGFGAIVFSIENGVTGALQEVHRLPYGNLNTIPSINNPTLPFSCRTKNGANSTNIKTEIGSIGAFLEGEDGVLGLPFSHDGSKSGIGIVETNLITIRNKQIYQGVINRVPVIPTTMSVSVDNVNGAFIRIFKGADVLGNVTWIDEDLENSVVEHDVAGTTVTGGTKIFGVVIPKNSSFPFDLSKLNIELHPGEYLVFSATSTGGNGAFDLIINWLEKF